MNTIKRVTPHAAVIIWNYRDRIGPDGQVFGVNTVDKTIISTVSLRSISTNKSKGSPAGSFTLEFAPTKNWVGTITSGSWLCVLMSQGAITQQDLKKANPNKVKFFGRVDSVRVNVNVDQESGARMTSYTVVGGDWGQIFNSTLYVDPASREPDNSTIGQAQRLVYNEYADQISRTSGLPTSTDNVKRLISLWGQSNSAFKAINEDFSTFGGVAKPDITFTMPKEVTDYFGFKTPSGGKSNELVSLLHLKSGTLTSLDVYKDFIIDVGVIKPDTLFGTHSFWQVLTDNCNHILNELVTDIRWEGSEPQLTIYKRVRPFAIRSYSKIAVPGSRDKGGPSNKVLGPLISRFENIKHTTIPLENVISFNAGTNWRDKYNYAELQVDQSLQEDVRSVQVKIQSAIFHEELFAREGFRPMIAPSKYLPADKSAGYNPTAIAQWKYILKEWYFDTHNMLNGSMTFVGIDDYIQVGDNILVDATVMGPSNNFNRDNITNKGKAYMLAHVESISNSFSFDPNNSARSFLTTINFVRGIITDANGKQFKDGRVDMDANNMTPDEEKNKDNVFTTSTALDPSPTNKDGT